MTTTTTHAVTFGLCVVGLDDYGGFFLIAFAVILVGCVFCGYVEVSTVGVATFGVSTFGLEFRPVWIFGWGRGSAVALAFFADVAFGTNDIDTRIANTFSVFAITALIALHACTWML